MGRSVCEGELMRVCEEYALYSGVSVCSGDRCSGDMCSGDRCSGGDDEGDMSTGDTIISIW